MDTGAVSTPLSADAATSQHSAVFGDDPFTDNSPVRGNLPSPRLGSSFWKRRRRSFVDPSNSEEIQRINALADRLSLVDSALKPYLNFRLNFAGDMARGSLILLHRRHISKGISASSSMLFGTGEYDEVATRRKEREDAVNDLNQRCYARVSERIASEVERHLMCEEATPSLAQTTFSNRYARANCDENVKEADSVDHVWLSNGSSLIKAFSMLQELCRTESSIVYRGRHRLTGIVYCIKRSVRRSPGLEGCKNDLCNALNECQALGVLRHTNVVRFYNSWMEVGSLMLQLEYCVGGSLLDCLRKMATMRTASSAPLNGGASGGDDDDVDGDDGDGGGACRMEEGGSRQVALRGLSDAALTKLLGDIASALDYMHTKWCMSHGKVGLATILVQLMPQAAHRAYRSEEGMEKAQMRCLEVLQLDESEEVNFKLASFGAALRVSEAKDTRGDDVYALAVTVCCAARGAGLASGGNEVNEVDVSTVAAPLQPILQLMLRPLAVDRVAASGVVEYLVGSTMDMEVGKAR